MDIKDFILIGGGLLIAAVVAHGFWIAWRARRDPLRIDIASDVPRGDPDEIGSRSELPNGGARVVSDPLFAEQRDLPLDPAGTAPHVDAATAAEQPRPSRAKTEPKLTPSQTAGEPQAGPRVEPTAGGAAPARPITADRSGEATAAKPRYRLTERLSERARDMVQEKVQEKGQDRPRERAPARAQTRSAERSAARSSAAAEPAAAEPVEELIMLHVLSPKGAPFAGPALPEFLRANGLRYGDMNIFHRIDPGSRVVQYSVANVTEPGTFDMADLENYRSRGVCFFMQLPGPEQPMESFEDMLKVARELAKRLDGELKDEQRSVMTGQTVEHYRQRISDFCRRRMSMRA